MTMPTVPDANDHDRALVKLCGQVLPVWARQLASSRLQSESAVAEMLGAFAEIGPHLDMATRQSGQITAALSQDNDGMTGLAQACERELRPVIAALDAPAAAAIGCVMDLIHNAVDALEHIAKPFERETQLVGQQVERMYRGFQYQDRISQMLTLLHQDIERLEAAMADSSVDVDAMAWLARLESQYVMTEQRHQHGTPGDDPAAGDEETTFF